MNDELKAQIPFGNYTFSSDKMTVVHLDIKAIVKGKKDNLSANEDTMATNLINKYFMNDIFGKDFKINILRKDGSVFFDDKGDNVFFDPSLFVVELYAQENLIDADELYSHIQYKSANDEITAFSFAKDKNNNYIANNPEISKLILSYYLKDEDHFFEFQELLNIKTNSFYLSSNPEERDNFLNYIKEKNNNIASYIEENIQEKPQRKFKV